MWQDPAKWYRGAKVHFSLLNQIKTSIHLAKQIFKIILEAIYGSLFYGMIIFLTIYFSQDNWFDKIKKVWIFILIPSLAIFTYGLVHVETRYLSPFFTILIIFTSNLANLSTQVVQIRIINVLGIISISFFILYFALNNMPHYSLLNIDQNKNSPHISWRIAQEMYKLGLRPGDKVASLKHSVARFPLEWARIARVSITGEVFYSASRRENRFWDKTTEKQKHVLEQFRKSGIRAVVTQQEPTGELSKYWKQLDEMPYYTLFFDWY